MDTPVFLPASTILARLLTVDADNSGLNANTLQGYVAADFSLAGHTHSYQPLDTELTAIAGLTSAANTVPSFTGSGTAALLTVGTGANNLVQLTAASKLPAVDGSLLTNLPTPSGVLLATGATTGATAAIQPFTLGIQTGKISTLIANTNAFGLFRVNGTTQDFYYDNVNGRFSFGVAPSTARLTIQGILLVNQPSGTCRVDVGDGSGTGGLQFNRAAGGAAFIDFYKAGVNQARIGFLASDVFNFMNAVYIDPSTGAAGFGVASPVAYGDFAASTTARASVRIPSGVRPTNNGGNPNDGAIWNDGAHLYWRMGGVDHQLDN